MEIPPSGAVFIFGKCNFGQSQLNHFFIKNDTIVTIACGDNYSAVICESGRLYTFGVNKCGQLGLGHHNSVNKPSCVKSLKEQKVVMVACGLTHTLILTETAIYGCGSNKNGQLGFEFYKNFNVPVSIEHDEINEMIKDNNIKNLIAGSNHSALLTRGGIVFVWGSNIEGQIGLGANIELCPKPTKILIDNFVNEISCGHFHTVLITNDGNLFTFGENSTGKLGVDLLMEFAKEPQKVFCIAGVNDIYAGGNHNFVTTTDGQIYAFGSNLSGQLGLSQEITWTIGPTKVSSLMLQTELINKIACGENHSAFLTSSGKLYTCGDTLYGKLCLDNEGDLHRIYEPKLVTKFLNYKVLDVACGSTHTLILACKQPETAINRVELNDKFKRPQIEKLDFNESSYDVDEESSKSACSNWANDNAPTETNTRPPTGRKGAKDSQSNHNILLNNKVHSELSNDSQINFEQFFKSRSIFLSKIRKNDYGAKIACKLIKKLIIIR